MSKVNFLRPLQNFTLAATIKLDGLQRAALCTYLGIDPADKDASKYGALKTALTDRFERIVLDAITPFVDESQREAYNEWVAKLPAQASASPDLAFAGLLNLDDATFEAVATAMATTDPGAAARLRAARVKLQAPPAVGRTSAVVAAARKARKG